MAAAAAALVLTPLTRAPALHARANRSDRSSPWPRRARTRWQRPRARPARRGQEGSPPAGAPRGEGAGEQVAAGLVQARERLVEQHQLRLMQEAHREPY